MISPATDPRRLAYRDSGLPGDRVVEVDRARRARGTSATAAGATSSPTGRSGEGRPWDERVGEWLAPECDAFVVQREVLDPPAYVELWLKDAGRHGGSGYLAAYDAWLGWFEEQGIEGDRLRLGQPAPRRLGPGRGPRAARRPYAVEQPVAPSVEAWASAGRGGRRRRTRLALRVDVVQETHGEPGRGGSGDHRAAPAPGPVPRPPGRHGRGCARRRLRRRPHRRPDPRRAGPAAGSRPRRARARRTSRWRGAWCATGSCPWSAARSDQASSWGLGNIVLVSTRYRERP